jgi:hypothetical protein
MFDLSPTFYLVYNITNKLTHTLNHLVSRLGSLCSSTFPPFCGAVPFLLPTSRTINLPIATRTASSLDSRDVAVCLSRLPLIVTSLTGMLFALAPWSRWSCCGICPRSVCERSNLILPELFISVSPEMINIATAIRSACVACFRVTLFYCFPWQHAHSQS